MHADICHDDYDLSRWKPGLSIRGVHRLKTQILTRDVRGRKLVGATAVRTRLRRLSQLLQSTTGQLVVNSGPSRNGSFSLNYQDRGSRPGSPTDCDGTTSPELAQQPDRAQVQIVREGWAGLSDECQRGRLGDGPRVVVGWLRVEGDPARTRRRNGGRAGTYGGDGAVAKKHLCRYPHPVDDAQRRGVARRASGRRSR